MALYFIFSIPLICFFVMIFLNILIFYFLNDIKIILINIYLFFSEFSVEVVLLNFLGAQISFPEKKKVKMLNGQYLKFQS